MKFSFPIKDTSLLEVKVFCKLHFEVCLGKEPSKEFSGWVEWLDFELGGLGTLALALGKTVWAEEKLQAVPLVVFWPREARLALVVDKLFVMVLGPGPLDTFGAC